MMMEPATRALLIGKDLENDYEVTSILQNVFKLSVSKIPRLTEFVNGINRYTDEFDAVLNAPDVVYILANFEGDDFRTLHERHSKKDDHYRLISSHAVRTLCLDPKPTFPILKDKRPVYCFFMTNMTFAMELQKCQTKRTVDLIHFMDGCVRKKHSQKLILIANECRSETYRTAVSLGSEVVTTQFIEKCWERRDDIDFAEHINEYKAQYNLRCFGGLVLFFYGFTNDSEIQEIRSKTVENGGIVTNVMAEATHIVVAQDVTATKKDFYQKGVSNFAHFVTLQWFWKSIHHEFCNNEDVFSPFENRMNASSTSSSKIGLFRGRRSHASPGGEIISKKGRKSCSRTALETSNLSEEYGYSEESIEYFPPPEPAKKRDKRFEICMEMLTTEQNYVDDLELLITLFKEPLERLLGQPNTPHACSSVVGVEPPPSPLPYSSKAILNKRQINSIFGKIQPILAVHRHILTALDSIMQKWDLNCEESTIGNVWSRISNELGKVYPPYVNDYDTALALFDECLASVPKFHSFVKSAESDPKCRKRTIKDLLIKPVQRLGSVCLLLDALVKKTDKHHKDFTPLKESITSIQAVLSRTNNSRKQIETYNCYFAICNQIEGYPSSLISAGRMFYKQVELGIISGDGYFGNHVGKSLTVFLFNDFVVFAKIRSIGTNPNLTQSFYGGTRGTLSRNLSFLQPKFREKKKYKLLSMHGVGDFRVIRYEYENEIVILKLRNDEGEYLITARPTADYPFNELLEFFKLLCKLSMEIYSKDILMEELTEDVVKQMKNSANEDFAIIDRAMNCARHGGSLKRRSTLRRAVSNVSLGISNGLQKFASRAHLSFINESSL